MKVFMFFDTKYIPDLKKIKIVFFWSGLHQFGNDHDKDGNY